MKNHIAVRTIEVYIMENEGKGKVRRWMTCEEGRLDGENENGENCDAAEKLKKRQFAASLVRSHSSTMKERIQSKGIATNEAGECDPRTN